MVGRIAGGGNEDGKERKGGKKRKRVAGREKEERKGVREVEGGRREGKGR